MKFIDLFSGIGGFHLAFSRQGAKCVFASEKDKYARITYESNFKKHSPEIFPINEDITKIKPKDIPDFDILCAGFPCQPFSVAGHKKGFKENKENRGNMFFIIRDIIKEKRPKAFFLENVRNLEKHDNGKTFKIIKEILEKLNYQVYYKIVKASDFGLPQHRPRIFIVGFRKEDNYKNDFKFPEPIPLKKTMSDIFKGKCPKKIGFTLRVGGRCSNINDRRNWDTYLVNGKQRRIGVAEGIEMMGLPRNFKMPVSTTQAMKQLGNSVAINAVEATAKEIIKYINSK